MIILFVGYIIKQIMITDSQLDDILDKVEFGLKSMIGYNNRSDFKLNDNSIIDFLANQYDVKLYNLLESLGDNIHYLESGIKNKIILRKQKFIDELKQKNN